MTDHPDTNAVIVAEMRRFCSATHSQGSISVPVVNEWADRIAALGDIPYSTMTTEQIIAAMNANRAVYDSELAATPKASPADPFLDEPDIARRIMLREAARDAAPKVSEPIERLTEQSGSMVMLECVIVDHARIVAEKDAEIEAWRGKLEPVLAERWEYKQRAREMHVEALRQQRERLALHCKLEAAEQRSEAAMGLLAKFVLNFPRTETNGQWDCITQAEELLSTRDGVRG